MSCHVYLWLCVSGRRHFFLLDSVPLQSRVNVAAMIALVALSFLFGQRAVYVRLKAPTEWRSPESFLTVAGRKGHFLTAASDVFMLGCCLLEVSFWCCVCMCAAMYLAGIVPNGAVVE